MAFLIDDSLQQPLEGLVETLNEFVILGVLHEGPEMLHLQQLTGVHHQL